MLGPTISVSLLLLPLLVQPKPTEIKTSAGKDTLTESLDKLKDGVAVEKTLVHHVTDINGHHAVNTKETETVGDPKTGKVVVEVEKVKANGGKTTTQVKLPAHPPTKKEQPQEMGHIVTPLEAAQYIFDTGEYRDISKALRESVKHKQMSSGDAQEYLQEVMVELEELHMQALREVQHEATQQRAVEDKALLELLGETQALSKESTVRKNIYNGVQTLYALYKTTGDIHAHQLLTKYINMVRKQVDSGNMDETVLTQVYGIFLEAVKEIEDNTAAEEAQEDKEEPRDIDANELKELKTKKH